MLPNIPTDQGNFHFILSNPSGGGEWVGHAGHTYTFSDASGNWATISIKNFYPWTFSAFGVSVNSNFPNFSGPEGTSFNGIETIFPLDFLEIALINTAGGASIQLTPSEGEWPDPDPRIIDLMGSFEGDVDLGIVVVSYYSWSNHEEYIYDSEFFTGSDHLFADVEGNPVPPCIIPEPSGFFLGLLGLSLGLRRRRTDH